MKRFLVIVLSLFLAIGLFGCGSPQEGENNASQKEDETPEKIVEMGEAADSGYWNLRINNVEELTEIKGHDEDDIVKPEGKFIAIMLDMKNISNEPLSYSLYEFQLMDLSTEKIYSVQDNGLEASIEYVSEEKFYNKNAAYITINDYVNPDDVKMGCVVFDVNPELDIKNLILLNENDGSEGEKVQFQLSE